MSIPPFGGVPPKFKSGTVASSITPSGGTGIKVGIGTAAPFNPLSVVGNSAASTGSTPSGILELTTGTGINTDNRIQFGIVDGSYSWIQPVQPGTAYRNLVLNPGGGNVGVGTVAPATLLSIGSGNLVNITSTGTVGIGPTAPGGSLHIKLDQNASTLGIVENANAGTGAVTELAVRNGTGTTTGMRLGVTGTAFTTVGVFIQNAGFIDAESSLTGGLALVTRAAAPLIFATNGHTNERMRILSGGNVGIATTTPGAKLEVNGTLLVDGVGTFVSQPVITAGGLAGAGTQSISTTLYDQSRLQNLTTNGSGLLQNNYNFSTFTFDSVETHGGGGSFRVNVATGLRFNDEFIPVDPEKYYRLAAWGKSGDTGGGNFNAGNIQYLGISPYDIDANGVNPVNYSKFTGSTDTTLAAQLNPGDTTVTLTSATGWQNAGGGQGYTRNFIWYGYTNSKGYTYPNYTYSRTYAGQYVADYFTNGVWAAGGISGNVITLRGVWTGPTLPAGTAVRNNTDGGTFKYITAPGVSVPNAWTRYEGYIGTYDTAGAQGTNQFPYGTAYIKLLFLINYHGAADNNIRWSDLWYSEMSSNNLEFSAASPTAYLHIKAGTATAGTSPLKLSSGTVNTTAEAGAIEYNGRFQLTDTDATRRHIVQAAASTKTTASAPYTNDGYVSVVINGSTIKLMTTA